MVVKVSKLALSIVTYSLHNDKTAIFDNSLTLSSINVKKLPFYNKCKAHRS